MNYLFSSFMAAVSFGLYNFFVGKSGNKISPFLGTLILSLVASAISLLGLFVQKQVSGKILLLPEGVKFAALAGLAAGIAEIFYFKAFSQNSNVSIVLPIVFTFTVITGILLGIAFNYESLTPLKIAGIVLGLVSLLLLARS